MKGERGKNGYWLVTFFRFVLSPPQAASSVSPEAGIRQAGIRQLGRQAGRKPPLPQHHRRRHRFMRRRLRPENLCGTRRYLTPPSGGGREGGRAAFGKSFCGGQEQKPDISAAAAPKSPPFPPFPFCFSFGNEPMLFGRKEEVVLQ